MARVLDLNADLGELPGPEGAALDEEMLALVTSANVAAGGHAGDAGSINRVCASAAALGVAVGAHVSYPDREGFGRRHIDLDPAALVAALAEQLQTLVGAVVDEGTSLAYVKPHGALYHEAAERDEAAAAVITAVTSLGLRLAVLTLPDSVLARHAVAAGLGAVGEAFADRGYDDRGRLVPRGVPGAVLTDEAEVVARVVRLARTGTVVAVDGTIVPVAARSVCLHSDTPGAVRLAAAVRRGLDAAGIVVAPFADGSR